jgi:diguanylate cyclase (GGDEF)-like protein
MSNDYRMPALAPTPTKLEQPPRWLTGPIWQCALGLATLTALYIVTARLGQTLALPPGNITPVWLPSGIMFGLALLWGPRIAPAVFLGALLGNAWAYFSLDSGGVAIRAVLAGTSNGIGDVIATVGMAGVYRRWRGYGSPFDRGSDLFAFLGVGAIAGGLISALFGVGALWGLGFMPTEAAPQAFGTWWTGDAVGVFVIAPVVIAWQHGIPRTWRYRDHAHALFVLAAAVAMPSVAFGLVDVPGALKLGMVVVAPWVLWTALHLGRRLSYLCLATVCGIAIVATAQQRGPFQNIRVSDYLGEGSGELIALQLFLAGLMTTILLLGVLATQHAAAQAGLRQANARLQTLSRTDALTELPNRLHMDESLQGAQDRAKRSGEAVSVLLIDIDHFKQVNDTWGHNTGDDVLRTLALALREGTREVDVPGRWGGEEFIVLLDRCAEPDAFALAEELRRRVARLTHPRAGRVTVSIGVAQASPGERVVDLVGRADQALYQAKAAGRDCTVVASGLRTSSGAPNESFPPPTPSVAGTSPAGTNSVD